MDLALNGKLQIVSRRTAGIYIKIHIKYFSISLNLPKNNIYIYISLKMVFSNLK